MRNGLSALDTALELHRRGLWPVPLHPRGAAIGAKIATGKEPIGRAWGEKRPTADDLRQTFAANPGAGVGIVLGKAGGVVDFEVDGPEGEESLVKLFGGPPGPTAGWSSRRGPHRLFAWDDRLADIDLKRRTTVKIPGLPGLELRLGQHRQAQSACPPTIGEDDLPRVWHECDGIARLPEAVIRTLEEALAEPGRAASHETNGVGRGHRMAVASNSAAAWFLKALEGEAGKVAMAREGDRHKSLLAAAKTLGGYLCHGYLSETDVAEALAHAGRRAGLPDQEVSETIRDGLAYGRAEPLPWPEKLDRADAPARHGEDSSPQPAPWPPLRLEEIPLAPSFPVDAFPPPLRRYCREVAAAIQVPVEFVGATMLAVAAAAVGQSVNLALSRTWTEPPLLYLILVGRSGSGKSPTVREVCRPLSAIDRRLRRESTAAREAWLEAKKAREKDPDEPPPGPEPPQLRAIVKDITRAALVIVLEDNPRGVLCDPDEASGWVASFNEYKGKGGSDRQFWLSISSGTPAVVDRKGGRENHIIPYPLVVVVGGMPPAMLGCLSEERGREDGFLDRCLFAFPDAAEFPRQRWARAEVSQRAEHDWAATVDRLHAMPMVVEADTDLPRPTFVRLTPEAERIWGEWFDRHCDEAAAPEFPEGLAGTWSKMRAHTARFALILSRLWLAFDPSADPSRGPVEADHVRGAIEIAGYFKGHAERVRHEMTGVVGDDDARAVLEWIMRNHKAAFREADVASDLRQFRRKPAALSAALKVLTGVGAVRLSEDARPAGPGRKGTPSYETRPDLLRAPDNTENTAFARDKPTAAANSGIIGIPGRVGPDEPKTREVIEL